VNKIKYKVDGSIYKYNTLLMAKGYTQLEGLDFLDTFSPVAKLTITQFLLFFVAINN